VRTRVRVRANDQKRVRSRDAQCNSEKSPSVFESLETDLALTLIAIV